jgi:transposase-like protein
VAHCTPATFTVQGFGAGEQHQLLTEKEAKCRAAALQIAQTILQKSLDKEITTELGEAHSLRHERVTAWQCRRCHTRLQCHFRRNGHYRRRVTIREGSITVGMPLVRCRCGGYVEVPWTTLDPYARYWLDVELDGIRQYLAGMSYRLTADALGAEAQASISHLQPWRTMQEVGEHIADTLQQPTGDSGLKAHLGTCPRAVVLDEVYITVGGETLVFLVAVADDARVLAVWGPTTRTVDSWQELLEWLTDHGISPAHGLVGVTADGDGAIREAVALVWPNVVQQQCVWHILERVAQDARAAYGRQAPEVEVIVTQATGVLLHNPQHAGAMGRAMDRLQEYLIDHQGTIWGETVQRAFWEGTQYLRTPGLQPTNGAAERLIKQLRRRIKIMDGFKSRDAARNFASTWRLWQNMRHELALAMKQRHRRRRRNLKDRHLNPKLP